MISTSVKEMTLELRRNNEKDDENIHVKILNGHI